jgi:YidC/Oxa1 family membrane protein insertase
MFLAFNLSDIVTVPFGYLMELLYRWTANYGAALILFAIAVKIIMIPINAKGKKSMMKMSRLTPDIERIKKKYPDDTNKQQQLTQELYKKEGVSTCGGCLWSFIPLLILLPLYTVIRQPIEYMLGETAENAQLITETIKAAAPELFGKNEFYAEMVAARHIPEFIAEIRAVLPEISEATLAGVNFDFIGIDLGKQPSINVFGWEAYDWANIGLFLIPLLSAGSQVLSMLISNKLNDSVVTNEKGIQDKETAKQSQQNQTAKTMMWMMPIMSLWIGFTVPCALSVYWLISGVLGTIADAVMTKHYRKIYDAEDAIRLQMTLEQERLEAEKERIRAERRAANPDGITDNTSKKKLQQKQKSEQQAAKAAAAREYAAKKGLPVEEEVQTEKQTLSGIADRPYCKGRAYDPNRYRSQSTEE